jgi:hypothetical protein
VKTRVKRTERALARAEDRIDDGDDAGPALTAVRRNLAAALKSAKRRVGSEKGPASVWWVARTQNHVVESTVSLFDGASGQLVLDLTDTLDTAIDGRDELIAAAGDDEDYTDVLAAIEADVAGEIEAIDEALEDDMLTSESQAALEAAREKLVATQESVAGSSASAEDEEESEDEDDEPAEDCPEHGERAGFGGRGPGGRS